MENKKQNKIKMNVQTWFIVICVGIVAVTIIFFNCFTALGNYKRQTTKVLNKYKNGETTRQEAIERISTIIEKVKKDNEMKKNNSFFYLGIQLDSILYDLKRAEIGNTQVDEKIKEIKKIH